MNLTPTLTCLLLFFTAAGAKTDLSEQKNVTAESGQNVTLPCRAPNINITVLEWSRADLGTKYVLLYRDGHFDPEEQHPSFKNRVDLQDRQMKDGDVSVILRNLTSADDGKYECRIFMNETHSWKSVINVTLRVDPPGPGGGTTEDGGKDGSVGLIVGLSVPVVLLAAVVGFLIFIIRKRQSRGSSQPPDKEQSSEMCPVYLQVSSESPDPDSVLSVNSGKEG